MPLSCHLRLVALATVVRAAASLALQRQTQEEVEEAPQHYWPHARGKVPGQFGVTERFAPKELDTSLAWSWHHPGGRYHTTVAGGPVIDNKKNLYLTTNDGIRKFSQDGEVLWHYAPPGDTNNEPALMGNALYGNTNNGHAFALSLDTGMPLWVARPATDAGGDVGYPAAYAGLYVMGVDKGHDPRSDGGNRRVVALNGTTGEMVWEFLPEYPVWNLMPLFPGDDTCVFMDFTGGVYRLGLSSGALIWHTPAPASAESFSDGGVILGPDQTAFTCSNPWNHRGSEGTKGALRAFQLTNGQMLWEQILPQPCNSWPAVGRLGFGRAPSVVITPGSFMGTPSGMHGGIMAFDAKTGEPQWQYQAPVYKEEHGMAKGDVEGYGERMIYDPAHRICLPAHWSAPTISGDGTVYAGRSDGKLYAVHGPPDDLPASQKPASPLALNYKTSHGVEVEEFDAEGASLHGATAFAPGMMAFATCDTLYVFKY